MTLLKRFSKLYNKTPHHLKVASVGWITRIVTAITQLFSIRILISYLGMDLYAGFVILTSFAGWFALSEFGVGASLQNFISEYKANNKNYKSLLNSAMLMIFILFIISLCIVTLIFVPLQSFLFKNQFLYKSQPLYIFWMVGFFYIITSLCGVAYRVYYAEQRGYLANIYPAIGNVVSFFILIIIDIFSIQKGNLTLALLVFIIPTTLTALYAFYDIFIKGRDNSKFIYDFKILKIIFLRSYKFAGFTLLAAIVLQIDYIVMSRILNSTDITVYNIISKIYVLMFFVYNSVLMALWPTCTELLHRKEWSKVNSIIRKHLLGGMIIIISGTIIFIISKNIVVNILASGKNLTIPVSTVLFFGLYYILRIWSDTYSIMLQSLSKMKVFWLFVPVQGLISFSGQYFCGKYFGLNGIVCGLILSFLFTAVWILPWQYYRITGKDL